MTFFIPTIASSTVSGFSADLTVQLRDSLSERPEPDCKQPIECTGSPVTSDEFIGELKNGCSDSGYRYLHDVKIGGESRIRLEDGDYWIGRYHDRHKVYKKKRHEVLDSDPLWPPTVIRIRHRSDQESGGSDITINVSIHSDIWFADTEIGKTNHERLRAFLTRIYRQFDFQRVEYSR